MDNEDIIEMRLCEAQHVMLKPDKLYRFTVDMCCEGCVNSALVADPDGWGKLIQRKPKGAR